MSKTAAGSGMVATLTSFLAAGCVTIPRALPPEQEGALRERAIEAVKQAVRYEHAGSIRAEGIEVLQRRLGDSALPWIRIALRDDEPGVRFAALMAIGTLRDQQSQRNVRTFLDDENPNLRIAAYYALHRLGDTRYTARLAELLLNHSSPEVRKTTALVLGLLGESGAVKLLAKAMKDDDQGVRNQALESMALLKNPDAIQQLTFQASSGDGRYRVMALNTLADLASGRLENTFQYKLSQGEFLETRLAAARGLGMLHNRDGLPLALEALNFNRPRRNVPHDPPAEQIMRVRQLAARALGAIGDRRALPALQKQLDGSGDPRVQLAAADAILEILEAESTAKSPWLNVPPPAPTGAKP